MPYNTSVGTTGDSSEQASPDEEIQVSAAIVCPLMVSKFTCVAFYFKCLSHLIVSV